MPMAHNDGVKNGSGASLNLHLPSAITNHHMENAAKANTRPAGVVVAQFLSRLYCLLRFAGVEASNGYMPLSSAYI